MKINMVRVFKALGDETRLKMVRCFLDKELCACYCAPITKKNQTTISRHLKVLTEAGIIKYKKCGRHRYYSIKDKAMKKMLLGLGLKPLKCKG